MAKSRFSHKSHNATVLMYHLVCPAKYRRVVFSDEVDKTLKEVCWAISERYEIYFLEIGADKDHVHFLIQSVPTMSPKSIAQKVKSITAREVFKKNPEVKQKLWGGAFWSSGYFMNTVGQHGNEDVIANYVKNQGNAEYKQLHRKEISPNQISLFMD
ncbi:IS200/IS605 family transposase [Endozoicomonas arenosclerae]|uniref:IS200/IS605 family transposase n=1 Tax=Endozoicomonas arenosclerae TaxID=1633495 RepID=UPI0007810A64|nr:IS200/IS605 family transposase [Endozoicomonas arenosclerae]